MTINKKKLWSPRRWLDYFYVLQKPGSSSLWLALDVDPGDIVCYKFSVCGTDDFVKIFTNPIVDGFCSERESILFGDDMLEVFSEIANNRVDWERAEISITVVPAPAKGCRVSQERQEWMRWDLGSEYVFRCDSSGEFVLEDRVTCVEKKVNGLMWVYRQTYVQEVVEKYLRSLTLEQLERYADKQQIDLDVGNRDRLQSSTVKTRVNKKILANIIQPLTRDVLGRNKSELDAQIETVLADLLVN
jgi:hypothetical protein